MEITNGLKSLAISFGDVQDLNYEHEENAENWDKLRVCNSLEKLELTNLPGSSPSQEMLIKVLAKFLPRLNALSIGFSNSCRYESHEEDQHFLDRLILRYRQENPGLQLSRLKTLKLGNRALPGRLSLSKIAGNTLRHTFLSIQTLHDLKHILCQGEKYSGCLLISLPDELLWSLVAPIDQVAERLVLTNIDDFTAILNSIQHVQFPICCVRRAMDGPNVPDMALGGWKYPVVRI